ncbi:hypothetical protein OAJ30_02360 [Alphaproteobacteria bacterium]|nr:hypothetical protein [Alphaproteobacteria bacterium]
MTEFLKKITKGLDLLVLLLIFIYTAIYILKYEIIFFQKIIIFSAIIALIIKILYWIIDNNIIKNYKNLLLLRIAICIFLYLTPAYYLYQYQNLIISKFIVTSTLIIITFFALLVIVVEKIMNNKKMSNL